MYHNGIRIGLPLLQEYSSSSANPLAQQNPKEPISTSLVHLLHIRTTKTNHPAQGTTPSIPHTSRLRDPPSQYTQRPSFEGATNTTYKTKRKKCTQTHIIIFTIRNNTAINPQSTPLCTLVPVSKSLTSHQLLPINRNTKYSTLKTNS